MEDFFANFELCSLEEQVKKYSPDPVETVRKSVTDAIQFYKNPNFTIKKKGKNGTIETSPTQLWQERSDGSFQVFVKYSRKALKIKGADGLKVPRGKVEDALNSILKAIDNGQFDEQIHQRSAEFTAKLKGKK